MNRRYDTLARITRATPSPLAEHNTFEPQRHREHRAEKTKRVIRRPDCSTAPLFSSRCSLCLCGSNSFLLGGLVAALGGGELQKFVFWILDILPGVRCVRRRLQRETDAKRAALV